MLTYLAITPSPPRLNNSQNETQTGQVLPSCPVPAPKVRTGAALTFGGNDSFLFHTNCPSQLPSVRLSSLANHNTHYNPIRIDDNILLH